MNFISTRNNNKFFNFTDAVLMGLAPDGGLFVPENIPILPAKKINNLNLINNIQQVGLDLLDIFMPEISSDDLLADLADSLNFEIPLIKLDKNIFLLEVFHGPTLAFKDVGARFMARIISRILQKKNLQLNILVATSGDTGSAVAAGFYQVPNVRVYVLYPSGRVSHLQEQQMVTLGGNIFPLEVQGSFDDCQYLVKNILQDNLFLDTNKKNNNIFSTANSINVARLLPQMIYHAWSAIQLKQQFDLINPIMCVPSGNFGNLVSAVYAHARGVPMQHFIAAINGNLTFTEYLATGNFTARSSKQTFSSAMDVGNPSNFERLNNFYQNSVDNIRNTISAISIDNNKTIATIRDFYQQNHYLVDPHTAVGIAAAKEAIALKKITDPIIVTATAHPAKFPEVIKLALGDDFVVPTPDSLQAVLTKPKVSQVISSSVSELKAILMGN